MRQITEELLVANGKRSLGLKLWSSGAVQENRGSLLRQGSALPFVPSPAPLLLWHYNNNILSLLRHAGTDHVH